MSVQEQQLWKRMLSRSFHPSQWWELDEDRAATIEEDATMWVYKVTEPGCYTVGFYAPDGTFHTDSDHNTKEEAAARVNYLNGGNK